MSTPILKKYAEQNRNKKSLNQNGSAILLIVTAHCLVRVARVELTASWTPFKRATKLRYTRSTGLSQVSLIIIANREWNVNTYFEEISKNKNSVYSNESTLFFMVELTGVEPVSEKKSVRVSPGAVCLLDFPWCGRAHTHYTLVAS